MSNVSPQKKDSLKHPRLVLLDAHAIIHRAYHALPDFSTSQGEPTGGLFGVSTMLMNIIKELKPDYLAACYDLPKPTFRHEAYDEYKAGRKEADDALVSQIIRSRDIFSAFNIPIYEAEGFEADDILGTIAEKLKKEKVDVVIASGDMDTLQLVDDARVQVYTLRKGMNDTVLYDEAAVKERFSFGPEQLPDFKGLSGDPSDNIPGIVGIGAKTATTCITHFGSIEAMYKALGKKGERALEDAGLKPKARSLILEGEDDALFSKTLATIRRDAPIDFMLPKEKWKDTLDPSTVEALFAELEFRSLTNRFRELIGEGGEEKKEEEEVEEDYTERELKETAIALWLVRSDITNPSIDDVLSYAGTKSFSLAKEKIVTDMKNAGLEKVYTDIEEPLIDCIERAEKRGVLLDGEYIKKLADEYHAHSTKLEKVIWKHAGREFNINSPKQLGEVLFDEMGLSAKGLKKTAGGARSTRESELVKLKDEHEIIPAILEYREVQKLVSTYIDVLPGLTDENNRIHTTLCQTGTTTGRFSSMNPNLQNIPTRGDGDRVRDAFIAPKGSVLVAADYSQIEMRILALLSKDEVLLQTFREGKDVHASVASRVFGVGEDEVTKDMRRKAKVINFGIVYGMGVNALKENIGGTQSEARAFYDQYFEQFPSIATYFDDVKKTTAQKGYTETYFGRRRHFADIRSHVPYIKAAAERAAMNAPIQGTAADIIKIAMRKVDDMLEKEFAGKAGLLLQVHDELIVEADESIAREVGRRMKEVMESAVDVGVPLTATVSSGKHWGSLESF
jgi:DNA polymerase-1